MKSSTKYAKIAINLGLALLLILLCAFVLPKLLMFFMPFLIGWILAMIANPLVRFLEKKLKIVRKAGTVVVIVLVLGLVALGSYLLAVKITEEVAGFIRQFPDMWEAIKGDLTDAQQRIAHLLDRMPQELHVEWADVETLLTDYAVGFMEGIRRPAIDWAGSLAKNLPLVIISIIFSLLSAYFFIAEREQVLSWVHGCTPKSLQEKWGVVYNSLAQAVGGYFKAQLKIMGIVYIIVLVGLLFCQVNYAVIIAFFIALLDFFPFFGTGTVMVPWAVIKVLSGDYMIALGLVITWGISQVVRQVIQPKIMGDSMGMHPIPSLFLLYIGFRLGGAPGLIIAIPVGMIVVNLYKAGVFEITRKSLRILIDDVNTFRKL